MSRREALIACYRSGQISERQWQQHLAADKLLAAKVQPPPLNNLAHGLAGA